MPQAFGGAGADVQGEGHEAEVQQLTAVQKLGDAESERGFHDFLGDTQILGRLCGVLGEQVGHQNGGRLCVGVVRVGAVREGGGDVAVFLRRGQIGRYEADTQ